MRITNVETDYTYDHKGRCIPVYTPVRKAADRDAVLVSTDAGANLAILRFEGGYWWAWRAHQEGGFHGVTNIRDRSLEGALGKL